MMSVEIRNLIVIGMVSVALFVSVSRAAASDFYVSQNGAGITNSMAWLDAPAHWNNGAGTILAGDTIHLYGTFTNTLTVGGSGSAGNSITILFEPNAKFSAPTLATHSSWIYFGGKSWIVIDGGLNGRIELTDNGTVAADGGDKTYGNSGIDGVNGNNGVVDANHIVIKNLTIANMYFRETNSEPVQGSGDGAGISLLGSDILVSNCFITGCEDGIDEIYTSTLRSNLTIIGCTISNYNHGFTLGSGGVDSPLFYNLVLRSNVFQGGDMFESPDGVELGLHRNPIFLFNESSDGLGCISNIEISYNYIKHGVNPQSHTAGTAAMFFDLYRNDQARHVRVFNNISTLAYPISWSGMGGFIEGVGIDVLVANNTAVSWQTNGSYGSAGQISIYGTNAFLYNNIVVSGNGITAGTFAATAGLTNTAAIITNLLWGVWSDYNVLNHQTNNSFVDVIYIENGNLAAWNEGIENSFHDWTNRLSGALHSHFDPHSLTSTVQLDSNFIPLSTDTVATGNGTNLTAWGITNDFAGHPRPTTGNWTIGAYQSPAPLVSLVASPTSVTSGQYSTLTWSSVNANNLTLSGFGLVAPNGSTNVLPTQITTYITTYIAKAIGTNGTFLASVSVTNLPSPPLLLRVIGYNSQ